MRRLGFLLLVLLAGCDEAPLTSYPPPTVVGAPTARARGGCSVPGLVKQHVTVPLGAGIRSDVDPKLLPLDYAGELVNSRLARRGEVVKRTGTRALGTGLLGTTDTLPASWAMGTLGDCLVSLSGVGDHPANMYSSTALQWATDAANGPISTGRKGPLVATPTRVSGIGHYPDMAYGSGYYFIASRGGPGGGAETAIEIIIDATTGKKVAERTYTDVAAVFDFGVRVVNGYAVFVRDTTANDLKFDAWQISNLDAGPVTTTFATTSNGTRTQTFDMFVRNATTVSAVFVSGGNSAAVDFVPSTNTATAWQPLDQAGIAIPITDAQGFMLDPGGSGKLALITVGAVAGLRVHWGIVIGAGIGLPAVSYVMNAAPGSIANVAGYTRSSDANGEFTVLYDDTSGPLRAGTRTAGVISATLTYYRGVAMRSKPWQQGTNYYIVGEFNSTTQTTRYVLQLPTSGTAIAAPQAIAQVRGGLSTGPLSSAVSPASGTWVSANTVQIRLPSNPAGYAVTDTGIEMLSVSFKGIPDTTTGAPREAIGSLFVPGGMLGQMDGTVYAEAGFAYSPETPAAPALAGGGALTAASTYYWKFVYAYSDASGRIWRSAPSLFLSQAMGASTQATFAIPTLRLTGRSNITIEVYRGGANDSTTFQKVGTVANNIAVDTVTFVDGVADTVQASGEELYTNGGGVLPNDSIPGFTAVAVAGNRVFGISADDTSVIWPSNLMVDGQGLRFSENNKIVVRDTHGGFYGIAAQPNGNVVALKGDATYVLSGDGPDAAGRGGFLVTLISSDVGTRNPRSVVETSEGVEFQSTSTRAGWYRVSTGLSVDYIGAPVEAYSSRTVVGGILVPSRSEVRWYTSAAEVLVRDLVTGGWTVDTFADIVPVAVTAYGNGAAMYDSATLSVMVDDATIYTDNGFGYRHAAASAWLKLADLKGYERFYRIQGVGETVGAHDLLVQLYKDFDDVTPFHTETVTAPGPLWDWEVKYSAKLHALKVRLSYTSSNAGAKMSDLVVEYGVKQGMGRLAASKRGA